MTWFDALPSRVSAWAKRLSVGALGAWSCLALSTLVAGGRAPSPMAALFVFGVLAACLMPMLAVGALLLAPLPRASPAARASWPLRQLGLLILGQFALTAALAQLLAVPAAGLVPERYAFHAEIGRLVAWHASSALVALGSLWLLRRRAAYPFWTWGVLHLAVRVLTDGDVALIAPGREHWIDLGSAVLYLSAFSVGTTAGPTLARLRLALLTIAVACALTTIGLLDRAHRARAELSQNYPSLASMLSLARSLLDLDGDGFASMLGGRDCDDDDPLVDPTVLELVGNGLDDNCTGGDLKQHTARGPARRVAKLQHNVVLVTIDALRADALSLRNAPDDPMPRLRDFGRRGAVFSRAYVAAPFTQDSLHSLLTGNYPMNMTHGNRWMGTEPDLAGLLGQLGYTTQVVQQIVFRESGQPDASRARSGRPHWGRYRFYENFHHVDYELAPKNFGNRGITSEETTTRAIAHFDRLDRAGRPFLLWVHYYDPHAEYMPRPGTPFPGTSAKARYWQEVWSTDKALGRLFAHLEAAGHFDRGLLALTGDHGESLGENGRHGHAICLAEHCLRTVLVLRGVSIPPGVYGTRVRVFDLFPTLLELAAGVLVDSDAETLSSIWREGRSADRDVFARTSYEARVLRAAAIIGPWKLTDDVLAGTLALHQLEHDPGESSNLIEAHPERAAVLRQRMGEVWDRSMNDRLMKQRSRDILRKLCREGDPRACVAEHRPPEQR
jgi:arylsulfatase A-like enzyme